MNNGQADDDEAPMIGSAVAGEDGQQSEKGDERTEAERESFPDPCRTGRKRRHDRADTDCNCGPADPSFLRTH